MSRPIIEQIRRLDRARESRALAEDVTITCPLVVERFARERLSSPAEEARRIAAIQLRVVTELGARLEWLEAVSHDLNVEPASRVALAALARCLTSDIDGSPARESAAAPLLETAALFHRLITHLSPWLPPVTVALEPEPVLDILQLGVPDYLHPLLHQRFDDLWALFHELRRMPAARLAVSPDAPGIDELRLADAMADARRRQGHCPPPPAWLSPRWINPWLGAF